MSAENSATTDLELTSSTTDWLVHETDTCYYRVHWYRDYRYLCNWVH